MVFDKNDETPTISEQLRIIAELPQIHSIERNKAISEILMNAARNGNLLEKKLSRELALQNIDNIGSEKYVEIQHTSKGKEPVYTLSTNTALSL